MMDLKDIRREIERAEDLQKRKESDLESAKRKLQSEEQDVEKANSEIQKIEGEIRDIGSNLTQMLSDEAEARRREAEESNDK